jgi:RNA-binding protein
MLDISADQRRALRARAHDLNPVVTISQNGLSDSVLQEIGSNLDSHELIKIRVFNDDRAEREKYLSTICEQLSAVAVQHIGKLLVVWRPSPAVLVAKSPRRRVEPRRSKRSFQGNSRS